MKKRIVVGISGASGILLGIEMLRVLHDFPQVETHLVISDNSLVTAKLEASCDENDIIALADCTYGFRDMAAAISSGSFKTAGMVVIPCSMKTLAGIVNGYSDNLLLRAADVTLKEGRLLVVVPRETPFNRIHLRNMLDLHDCGAVILPPMMTFYSGAETAQEMVTHLIGKILDQFGIDHDGFKRWGD